MNYSIKRKSGRRFLCLMTFCLSVLTALSRVSAAEQSGVPEPVSAGGQAGYAEGFPIVGTVFNDRNGLPTGEANDVLQTDDGYIWIGSYGGLVRYDGSEFRNFSMEGHLPTFSVRTLFEDSEGRLWIGSNDAGVFVMENGEITRPEGQPEDNFFCIRGFAQGDDGTIYVNSSSGMGEIRNGMMSIYMDDEVAGHTVYSMGVDCFGRLWGTNDSSGGCVVLQDGVAAALINPSDYFGENETVYSITYSSDGAIWLGSSDNNVVRLEFLGEGFSKEDIRVTAYTLEEVSVINSLRETSGGLIAVSGLHGYALLSPDGSVVREISEEKGASNVNSSDVDYQGNIWLASTDLGVVKYSEGCFSAYEEELLSGTSFNAIAVLDGRGYMGCNSGLIIAGGKNSSAEQELENLLSGVRIRDIMADSQGNVWIASYSEIPVVCYHSASGEIDIFSSANGLCNDRARVFAELDDGSVAVGTQGGLSIIAEGAVKESYTDFDSSPVILSLLEMPDGTILAGSDGGGIYRIKDGKVTTLGFSEGLSEGVVLRILQDADDCCFVSAGSSLYYMKDGRFEKLTALKKEAGSIFDFYLLDGKLWLLQNSGLIAVEREDLLAGGNGNPVLYSFEHGLTGSLNANTRHCLSDGRLYLATRNGVSVFGFQTPENVLPKAVINSVTVDDVIYEHPERITIGSGTRRVSVNYAVLSYNNFSNYETTYELAGFDNGENPAEGDRNFVSYTNLQGGEYVFRLRIFDPDSGQSAEYSFGLIKEKMLAEQPLFWVGVIVLAIAAVAGIVAFIYGMKLKNIRRRQQEYRDIIEEALRTFASTIDAKDKYTNDHSTRVAYYSRELARRLGMSIEEQENIYYIALLHDVGKIGVPDQILNKPGRLTDEELEVIRKHPATGADILKNFTSLKGLTDGARYHHERYDGGGYCEGKAGEDIPLTARIIAVADTYDAMSSDRCYRKGLPRDVIEEELKKGAGTQFDPKIVPHMLDIIAEEALALKAIKSGV